MSITIIKDKSGRPIKKDGLTKYRVRVNYTVALPDGKSDYRRIERYAYGKIQAQEVEAQLTQDASQLSCLPGDCPPTFSAFIDAYLSSCLSGRINRQSTVDKKREILEHHILPSFGHLQLSQITQPVIYSWIDLINSKQFNGSPLSLCMKRKIFAALRASLTYAVKRGWLQSSPLDRVDNFKDTSVVPAEHQELHFYTSAQFNLYITGLRQVRPGSSALRYLVLFYILFYTGARKGEANALHWEDYDASAHTLYIRRSVNLKAKGGPVEGPPKNQSSYRKIPIPAKLISIINDQLAYQKQDPAWSDSWYICGGPAPIPDTSIENANADSAKAVSLPHIRIHDFRHSHASLLINAGINIKAISKRLGHATVDQTWNRYGHLYPEQDDHIISVLDNL